MCKVTLAIPIYNVERYVERSLLSALNQSFEDIEFLIVDDKGTDNSMKIVKDIKLTHPRGKSIRIVDHVVNKGLGATRNTSIENAQGKYLYFMDSDDVIEPDTIKVLYDIMEKEHADVVESSYQTCSVDGYVYEKHILPPIKTVGHYALCDWMNRSRMYYDGYIWNKLYDLSFLRSNNISCTDIRKNEDVLFSFQVVLKAKSIVTVPFVSYNYVMRSDSIVHQKVDISCYNQYIDIFNKRTLLMKSVNEKNLPLSLYNYYLQHFFEWWLPYILFGDFSVEEKVLFYKKIQKIYELDFTIKDLIGLRYKILYILIKKENYKYITYFYKIDSWVARCYNKVNSHFHITKLPYSHL